MTRFTFRLTRSRGPVLLSRLALPVLTCCLWGTAMQPALSAEPIRWKFKAGESLHYTMVQEITQQMKVQDRDLKSTMSQTVDLHWSIKSVSSEGVAEMSQTIDRVRSKVEAPGNSFEFDSQNAKEPEGPVAAQLTPLLKALVGAEFNAKMSPRGQIVDVKVPQKLLDSLRKAGPAASAGGMFSEEGLKNLISQVSLTFPEGEIEKGKSWKTQSRFPVPNIGTLVMDRTFTYQGPAPQAAELRQVSQDTSVKLEPAGDSNVAVKITSHDGKGEFLFDPQAGRIVSSHVNDKMQMSLSLQGQSFEQSTQTVTTMTLARDGGSK